MWKIECLVSRSHTSVFYNKKGGKGDKYGNKEGGEKLKGLLALIWIFSLIEIHKSGKFSFMNISWFALRASPQKNSTPSTIKPSQITHK